MNNIIFQYLREMVNVMLNQESNDIRSGKSGNSQHVREKYWYQPEEHMQVRNVTGPGVPRRRHLLDMSHWSQIFCGNTCN